VSILARLLILLVASAAPSFAAESAHANAHALESASGANFASLDEEHTYFVGTTRALVHNDCFDDIAKHAVGNKHITGMTYQEAGAYLRNIADTTLGWRLPDGAAIWQRGKEILVARPGGPGSGTFVVRDSKEAASEYLANELASMGADQQHILPGTYR
jgi:hypothetical protein